MPIDKPVVLITGASSGIGLALLRQLLVAPQRYRIVASARRTSLERFEKLGITENDKLRLHPLDLTEAAECEAIIREVEAIWGGVDILINNAGISYRSDSFENTYLSQAACEAIKSKGRYANYYWHMSRFIAHYMNKASATPETIARTIIRAMEQKHPPLRIPASWDARFFSVFSRITPRRFYHWLLYKKTPRHQNLGHRPTARGGLIARRDRPWQGSSGVLEMAAGEFTTGA